MGLGLAAPAVFPAPDGAISVSDRLQYLYLYAGISPGEIALIYSILIAARPYLPAGIAAEEYLLTELDNIKYLQAGFSADEYLQNQINNKQYLSSKITPDEEK